MQNCCKHQYVKARQAYPHIVGFDATLTKTLDRFWDERLTCRLFKTFRSYPFDSKNLSMIKTTWCGLVLWKSWVIMSWSKPYSSSQYNIRAIFLIRAMCGQALLVIARKANKAINEYWVMSRLGVTLLFCQFGNWHHCHPTILKSESSISKAFFICYTIRQIKWKMELPVHEDVCIFLNCNQIAFYILGHSKVFVSSFIL